MNQKILNTVTGQYHIALLITASGRQLATAVVSWCLAPTIQCTLQSITLWKYWNSRFLHAICHRNSCETLPFQYCNHVIDCNVHWAIGTRNPKTTAHAPGPTCKGRVLCGSERAIGVSTEVSHNLCRKRQCWTHPRRRRRQYCQYSTPWPSFCHSYTTMYACTIQHNIASLLMHRHRPYRLQWLGDWTSQPFTYYSTPSVAIETALLDWWCWHTIHFKMHIVLQEMSM